MFNFPIPSGVTGEIFSPIPGLNYRWSGAVWEAVQYVGTALPLNYIVNPNFMASQENADTASAVNGHWPADQWTSYFNTVATVFAVSVGRSASLTPNGSTYRVRTTVSTAKASLAATEYAMLDTRIEGNRTAAFKWGTASAEQAVVRFTVRSSLAGTYSLTIRNITGTRSFVAPISVPAANTDYERVIVVPGCTDGAWPIDNGASINPSFCIGSGSTFLTSANSAWAAGNYLTAISSTNGLGTAAATFDVADFGMYLDANRTGLAPKWTAPTEEENLTNCLRYWYACRTAHGVSAAATLSGRLGNTHPVPMRAAPAVAVGAVGGNPCYNWDLVGSGAITSVSNFSNTQALEFNGACAGGLTAGRACSLLPEYPGYLAVSARF